MYGRRTAAARTLRTFFLLTAAALLFSGCADDISSNGDGGDIPEGAQLVVDSKDQFAVERPAWIDNDTIIFSWNQDTPKDQLWIVSLGGSPSRFINDGNNAYLHPVYCSAVGMVAYELISSDFGGSNIYASTLSSNPRLTVHYVATSSDSSSSYPSWGSGGRAIGYMQIGGFGDKQVQNKRFVIRELDKSYDPPRITDNMRVIDFGREFNHSKTAWYPATGEDIFGGKVAYNRLPPNAEEGSEIYYYNIDLEQEVRLTDDNTPDGYNCESPSWSPDGAHIVYSTDFRLTSRPEFLRDLFIVSVETKAAKRLTRTGGDEKEPAWSPDGARIAYVSRGDLYVLPVDADDLP